MSYQHVKVPAGGQKITVNKDYSLNVPDQPIIPYIEGDGTGFDITPVMIKVVDAAVAKAYGGKRKIHWMEIYAGEKSTKVYGPDVWLPDSLDVNVALMMAFGQFDLRYGLDYHDYRQPDVTTKVGIKEK